MKKKTKKIKACGRRFTVESPHKRCGVVGVVHGLGWRWCAGCDTVYNAGSLLQSQTVPIKPKTKKGGK